MREKCKSKFAGMRRNEAKKVIRKVQRENMRKKKS